MAEPRHPQIHAFVVPSDHQKYGPEEAAEADQNFGKSSERPIRGDSHTGHMSAMPLKSRQMADYERSWIDERGQLGLLRELFLGILSTSSGSALSISRRAIRSINVAVVRPRRSASIAAVSTFRARPSRLLRNAISVPYQRCEMKNPTFIAELHKKLGAPSSEAIESLRLLKAFLRLAPRERFEVIELVERLATEASSAPDHPLS
jgi:hypothetical protein